VFGENGLVSSFEVMQTKNASLEDVALADYVDVCDGISQELYDESEAISAVIEATQGRKFLWDGEVVGCVTRLVVPAYAKGVMSWASAIPALITELASRQPGGMPFVLQAAPLEMAWWRSEFMLKRMEPDTSEEKIMTRRLDALIKLYDRRIRFYRIGRTDWMGRFEFYGNQRESFQRNLKKEHCDR
jgi:hypothetical protein